MTTGTKPIRGRQISATQQDVNEAWGRIRQAAEDGDLVANALLIALAESKDLPLALRPKLKNTLGFIK